MSELEPLFYDVPTFCNAAQISRSLFYSLQRDGRGPRVTKLGGRSLISTADAKSWRNKLSAISAVTAALAKERA
jgi:predicted DNA-binding transcriptional regulator AlpA